MTAPLHDSDHPLMAVRRTGTVSSLMNLPNTVGVWIGGDTTVAAECTYVNSYVPLINDVVVMLSVGGDHIILGSMTKPLGFKHNTKVDWHAGMSGGGQVTFDGTNLKWTERFIIIGIGRNADSPGGYYTIPVPSGGVSIPVYNESGVATKNTIAGGIALAGWEALYFELPIGGAPGDNDESWYRIVSWNEDETTPISVPDNWVFVALHNIDGNGSSDIKLGSGGSVNMKHYPACGNSWVDYALGYDPLSYHRTPDGVVTLTGMMKSGTTGTAVFTLPVGYRNSSRLLFMTASDTGHARIDILDTGVVQVTSYLDGGSNTWVSFSGISFKSDS